MENAERLLRNVEVVGEEYLCIWEKCVLKYPKPFTPSLKERLQDYKLRRLSDAETALKLVDDEFEHSIHCTCWQCECPF